jgi:hypothetical protein
LQIRPLLAERVATCLDDFARHALLVDPSGINPSDNDDRRSPSPV